MKQKTQVNSHTVGRWRQNEHRIAAPSQHVAAVQNSAVQLVTTQIGGNIGAVQWQIR